jgi:hypothetical protein
MELADMDAPPLTSMASEFVDSESTAQLFALTTALPLTVMAFDFELFNATTQAVEAASITAAVERTPTPSVLPPKTPRNVSGLLCVIRTVTQ